MNTSNDKIDQLFQQKLTKVEKTPRPEAWEKLASRLAEKDKPVVPIWRKWAVAASVAVLLLMGGVGYFNLKNTKIKPQDLAKSNVTPSTLPKQTELVNREKAQIQPTIMPKAKQKLVESNNFNTVIAKNNLQILKNTEKAGIHNIEIAQGNIPDVALHNGVKDENKRGINTDLPAKTIETTELAVIEEKVIETNNTIKPEDLTIVLTLNDYKNIEPKTEKLDEKKAPFFSRIFQQLKNAKNGDKVDWNEIGFKPAKLLARAETKFTKTQ